MGQVYSNIYLELNIAGFPAKTFAVQLDLDRTLLGMINESLIPVDILSPNAHLVTKVLCQPTDVANKILKAREETAKLISEILARELVNAMCSKDKIDGYSQSKEMLKQPLSASKD